MDIFPAKSFKRAAIESTSPGAWALAEIAGRLVEISGSGAAAALTFAFGLVLEAQRQGELVGWSTPGESFFYPCDAARGGVDLDSLVIIRVPDAGSVARAGEKLLRSGAFGLVVLDMANADIPMPLQARLAGLAHQHHAGLICLTEKEPREFSLGSLISLRVHARRESISRGQFACRLKVLKDKRRGPTWTHAEICCGPAGLC